MTHARSLSQLPMSVLLKYILTTSMTYWFIVDFLRFVWSMIHRMDKRNPFVFSRHSDASLKDGDHPPCCRCCLFLICYYRDPIFSLGVNSETLVQLLLPMVKLKGVSQPISVVYKTVHSFNQALLRT